MQLESNRVWLRDVLLSCAFVSLAHPLRTLRVQLPNMEGSVLQWAGQ